MNESIYSEPSSRNAQNKKKALFIMAGGVILLFLAIIFGVVQRKTALAPEDPDAMKQYYLSVSANNPPANLTEAEIKAKEDQMKLPNPPATLTPEEIEAKRAILEKN